METADGTAGDGDANEGKYRAGHHKSAAVDEGSDGGHVQRRVEDDDENPEYGDGAELHESAEVVAWDEEHPHRQDAGGEAINHDGPRELGGFESQCSGPLR